MPAELLRTRAIEPTPRDLHLVEDKRRFVLKMDIWITPMLHIINPSLDYAIAHTRGAIHRNAVLKAVPPIINYRDGTDVLRIQRVDLLHHDLKLMRPERAVSPFLTTSSLSLWRLFLQVSSLKDGTKSIFWFDPLMEFYQRRSFRAGSEDFQFR